MAARGTEGLGADKHGPRLLVDARALMVLSSDSAALIDKAVPTIALNLEPHEAITFEDSEAAVFLALRAQPVSDAARDWVRHLLDALVLPSGKIVDKPSSHFKAFKAIGALMADLLDLQNGRKDGGPALCGSRGMSPKHYPSKDLGFGYDIFVPVVEALKDAGFLIVADGKPRWSTWAGSDGADVISTKGRVTRFRLTRKAVESATALGVIEGDWESHWRQTATSGAPVAIHEPLVVLHGQRVRVGARKLDAPDLPVDLTQRDVARFEADLQDLNAFLRQQDISGFAFAGLRRIWNNGDLPGFAWQWGGRFASLPGGNAYETMSAERRLKRIRINGSPVAEVDIRACHLTLLYGLLREPLNPDQDPYAIAGLPRDVVKAWVGQAIGGGRTDFARWSPRAKEKYAEVTDGRSLSADFKARDVGAQVLGRHAVLKRLKADELDSVSIMFHEAEVLASAIHHLRLQGLPALPIHDGLIVPVADVGAAKGAMAMAFAARLREVTGGTPTSSPGFKVDMA